ncbi:MAG: penicillin acylase family protein, partial [Chromatiales bacterium]|nr:penicillin acylase family protein [Chromatiales bacterium]
RDYVNHWAAHDPEAVNLVLDDLLSARTVEQVVSMAKRAGLPGQNLVCADREGHIAWTVAGRIPRKQGEAGMLPRSWADGSHGWRGWLDPEEVPTVISPPGHRLWTANNRVASLEEQRGVFGNGGFDIGARAGQIRDRLLAKDRFTERDLLAIQMDDEARFLTEWRQLLLRHLDEKALADVPARTEYRRFVEDWAGRAAADDVGYFLVRDYRMNVLNALLPVLTGRSEQTDKRFSQWHLPQRDGVIWHLLQARPAHFLPAEWPDWHAFHLAMVDRTLEEIEQSDRPLSEHTWGFHNQGVFAHPFGNAMPMLAGWLNMPVTGMSGDVNLPRVQRGIHGASERMVVSPGREEQGFFHMPCGQSGHPLSPFYRAGHEAWLNGEPSPFLPGPPVHRLVLAPESR